MSGHEHTKRCYWDFREARWECRPEVDEPQLVGAGATAEQVTAAPAAASADGGQR